MPLSISVGTYLDAVGCISDVTSDYSSIITFDISPLSISSCQTRAKIVD